MAALGDRQAETELRDVYHTGILFFKTGTFVSVHGASWRVGRKQASWRKEIGYLGLPT